MQLGNLLIIKRRLFGNLLIIKRRLFSNLLIIKRRLFAVGLSTTNTKILKRKAEKHIHIYVVGLL